MKNLLLASNHPLPCSWRGFSLALAGDHYGRTVKQLDFGVEPCWSVPMHCNTTNHHCWPLLLHGPVLLRVSNVFLGTFISFQSPVAGDGTPSRAVVRALQPIIPRVSPPILLKPPLAIQSNAALLAGCWARRRRVRRVEKRPNCARICASAPNGRTLGTKRSQRRPPCATESLLQQRAASGRERRAGSHQAAAAVPVAIDTIIDAAVDTSIDAFVCRAAAQDSSIRST